MPSALDHLPTGSRAHPVQILLRWSLLGCQLDSGYHPVRTLIMRPELAKVTLVANTWIPFPPELKLLGTDSNDNPRRLELGLASFLAKKVETKAISLKARTPQS